MPVLEFFRQLKVEIQIFLNYLYYLRKLWIELVKVEIKHFLDEIDKARIQFDELVIPPRSELEEVFAELRRSADEYQLENSTDYHPRRCVTCRNILTVFYICCKEVISRLPKEVKGMLIQYKSEKRALARELKQGAWKTDIKIYWYYCLMREVKKKLNNLTSQ